MCGWYWPAQGQALVVTDRWPPHDRATVDAYASRISGGARPAAVTVRPPGGGPRYLIDGHHKLAAYRRTGVAPLLVEITREQAVPLRREEFAAIAPPGFARAVADWDV